MSYEVSAGGAEPRVVLSGAVDVREAAALWRALLDVATQEGPVEVDLQRCVDIDAAVLQLLLALRRSREAEGRAVAFVGANDRMRRALARFGLAPWAAAEPSR